MKNVIRVALTGYNALTDTNPNHFSLFTGEDDVLIKEHSRGVVNGQSEEVSHNINYYPHFYAYGEVSSGRFQIMTGCNLFGDFRGWVSNTKLYLYNSTGSDKDMRYFIFYDDIPE